LKNRRVSTKSGVFLQFFEFCDQVGDWNL